MSKIEKKIGLIGGGNMGEAFVGAMVKSVVSDPRFIYVSDVSSQRCDHMERIFHVSVTSDNIYLFSECDVIVFAVKPQQMGSLLEEIAGQIDSHITRKKLLISIAAGIPIKKIETILYKPLSEEMRHNLPIIRVMPNTPALVLMGMSGMSPNRYADDEDMAIARILLSAMGNVIEIDESDIDAVTALSGSGPAYVFYLIESMIAAGIQMGFSPEDANILTVNTVKGAVTLMEERKESAEVLRRQVTSPGGTTEAAIGVLEKYKVKDMIIQAISAAKQRAKTLSEELL